MYQSDELEKFREELRLDVENTFALRSKHPNRHFIVSRDKRYPYRVIENGKDVTPRPITIPGEKYLDDKEMVKSYEKIMKLSQKVFLRPEAPLIIDAYLNAEQFVEMANFPGRIERLDVWYSPDQIREWKKKRCLENIPSMYRLREDPPSKASKNILEFRARFKETPLVILLDIMSDIAPIDSEDAQKFEVSMKLAKDKAIKKKYWVIDPNYEAFTQTFGPLTREDGTSISAPIRSNASIDAHDADRIRCLMELGIIKPFSRCTSLLYSILMVGPEQKKKAGKLTFNSFKKKKESEIVREWLGSVEFLKTSLIVERMLIANLYSDLQFMYHDRLYSENPVGDFKFTPQLLWTCSCPRTYGKAVSSITWSRNNPEIFIVTYGKYLFETKVKNGLVCVWNIKNTEFPERMSILPSPVTYAEFSKTYPRIAGVSFWNGTVGLIDMVLREPEMLVRSDHKIGLLHPVWQVKWFQLDGEEILLSCGENGQLHTFELKSKFTPKHLLTIQRIGNTFRKGIEMPQTSPYYDQNALNPSIVFMAQYPKDEKIIFLASNEGFIYVYSLYKTREPLDVFGAHIAPITAIEFNPTDGRIFLTAGCDFYIRIWGYNIYETYLLQLNYRNLFVDYATWSPVHPYMIVSLSGSYIDVWNLKKNFYDPVTTIENPNENRNLVVQFNKSGANFLIGDMNGFVYVYSFTSIPKPPEDPQSKLAEVLLFLLAHDEERMKLMILKLGRPYVPDKEIVNKLLFNKKQ